LNNIAYGITSVKSLFTCRPKYNFFLILKQLILKIDHRKSNSAWPCKI